MTAHSSNNNRFWLVDLLRQLSITLVLLCHFANTVGEHLPAKGAWFWTDGESGVYIFFLVSGFVIAKTTANRYGSLGQVKPREFYVTRAARLLPLFLIYIAIGVACTYFCTKGLGYEYIFGRDHVTSKALFWGALATCTYNWFRVFNDLSCGLHWDIDWSLAIEEQFYTFFPWVARVRSSKTFSIAFLLGLCALAPLGRWYFHHNFPAYFGSSFCALDLMAAGILLHHFLKSFGQSLSNRPYVSHTLVALGSLGTICVLTATKGSSAHTLLGPTVMSVSLFALLAGGLCIGWIQKLPAALVRCGELSYGSYLLHPVVLFALYPLIAKLPVPLAFIAFYTITMTLAALSFRFFEQPMNRLIRKFFNQNETASSRLPANAGSERPLATAGGK